MPDVEWWEKWFTFLMGLHEELDSKKANQPAGGAWSIHKLAYVGAYAREVFQTVGGKHFDKLFYVDLLAGDGLTEVKDSRGEKHTIAGSALGIPALGSFDKVFVNDHDNDKVSSLKDRVDELGHHRDLPGYEFYNEDANEIVDRIVSSIWESAGDDETFLVMTFVDNQGYDVHMDTVSKLSDLYNDIFILFPTSNLRQFLDHNKKEPDRLEKWNRFFGGQEWASAKDATEAREIYTQNVLDCGRHERVSGPQPEIRGKKSHHYNLISSFRKTQSGSSFLTAANHLANRVDDVSWNDLQTYLDIGTDQQSSLLTWQFDEAEEEDTQASLTDF